jgi:hypothetical protein
MAASTSTGGAQSRAMLRTLDPCEKRHRCRWQARSPLPQAGPIPGIDEGLAYAFSPNVKVQRAAPIFVPTLFQNRS